MKRHVFIIAGVIALGLGAALVAAQTPAPAPPKTATPAATATAAPATPAVIGPAKVAWIDLEGAIMSTEEGKREFGEIQKFVDKKNQELQGLNKELETLKTQLNVQGPKLTDEARDDLQGQIEAKETLLQRFQQDTQKDIENRRVRTTNFIGRRMLPVVEKVSKEKGLSAVQYLNPSRDAWVDPGLIITGEVISAYNAAHPVTAGPAPPPKK
jgi:outer membrane protein